MLSHENMEKGVKGAIKGVLTGAGYAAKLAYYGLSAAEVVFNGVENLTNAFVKAPKLGLGKFLFDSTQKCASKISDKCIKIAKERF